MKKLNQNQISFSKGGGYTKYWLVVMFALLISLQGWGQIKLLNNGNVGLGAVTLGFNLEVFGEEIPVKGFSLGQNKPNPFSQSTEITYQLAGEFGAAFLMLYSVDGKFSKTITLNPKENTVLVNSMDLPNGALYYSLVVDGSVKDTKIMILNR